MMMVVGQLDREYLIIAMNKLQEELQVLLKKSWVLMKMISLTIQVDLIKKKNVYWCDVMKKSKKIINFLDLCGHEKYLKTTIYGMMSYSPDYAMIIVGSNSGLIGMSKEHIMIT